MQRSLVGAKVHAYVLIGKPLPEVHDIAQVAQRNDFLFFHCPAYPRNQLIEILVDFIQPALVVALVYGHRIYLGNYADNAAYHCRLRLGSGHPAQAGRYEEHAPHILSRRFQSSGFQLLACCVHYGYGRAVDYALRAYVHIRPGGHLSVLGDAHRVETLPIVLTGIVRDDHSVSHYDSRRVLVAWEKAQGMS